MKLFKTKKQKALEAERAAEAKRQKEFQDRLAAKATLRKMSKIIDSLDVYKTKYINCARKELALGNTSAYQMAKSSLKLCLTKQRVLESMVMTYEVALDTADMNRIVASFVTGIDALSKQINQVTPMLDFQKAQVAFNNAMSKGAEQLEALNSFMDVASQSVENMDSSSDSISDKDVDLLINSAAADAEGEKISQDIDSKIANLDAKLGEKAL